MRVCGIDPGLGVTGYAVLEWNGAKASVVEAGVCRTDARAALPKRLTQLEADLREVLEMVKPDAVAVEQIYAHYKHPRTAILMGHARGVLLYTAASLHIEVRNYSATQIKRFLTGNGRASKSQMQRAITATLGLGQLPTPHDVSDALAIALCCAHDQKGSNSRLTK